MFTRLSEFSNVKKDGTSQATKVIQLSLKLLNEDSSAAVLEEAMCLLHTLIDFFPSSVHRNYDSVEAAIVSKLLSGKCCPSLLKKLGHGLSLLPKSKGDEDSWSLMMNKILLYVNSQLNDAFQGLEEETKSSKALRALLPAGKEPPPPLGGLALSEQNSDISTRRPERLLASRISSLLQCCSDMLSTSYPVMVPVPISGLIALAVRVMLVDGSSSLASYSFMTTLKQELICSEIPILQLQSLEILTAVVKGLGSQILPHVADIFELLKEFLWRCKFPVLKIKVYSILKLLLMSMGVGFAIHVSQDVVRNVFIDLDFLGDKDSKSSCTNTKVQPDLSNRSHNKKRKRTKSSLQEHPASDGLEIKMSDNLTPISVKIAALEALEALLTVGGSIRSESWRGDGDKLLITAATYACRGGWSTEERKILLSGDATSTLEDFQVAVLRALLASLLSPGRVRPAYLALGLELFRRGTQATGTRLAEYCGHALLALEVLIHPRGLPVSDFQSSHDDYKAPGHLRDTYQSGEPESEDDDLIENWLGKDNEMEIQVTKRDASPDKLSSDPNNNGLVSIDDMVESPRFRNSSDQEQHMASSTANGGHIVAESESGVLESVGLELTSRSAALAENDIGASASEHVSEFSTSIERISATLAKMDSSKEKTFGADSENDDEFPDIVDGDPDSD